MLLFVLGLLGSVASIVGLYAVYDSWRNKRIKRLVYSWARPVPLATAAPLERDYELSIHYRRPGAEEEVIAAAYVAYLRFANFGREPIRRDDIATANRFRVEVSGARVLDIALVAQRRDVTQVVVREPSLSEVRGVAEIDFDFLDFGDGGVIRALTTAADIDLSLQGDIIGMPQGIRRIDEDPPGTTSLGRIATLCWVVGELLAFAAAAWAIKAVAGSWSHLWLLVLPFAAFLLPIVAVFAVSAALPRGGFPDELALPRWLAAFHPARTPHWPDVIGPEADPQPRGWRMQLGKESPPERES